MSKTCLNCTWPVEGNYCSNCGQSAAEHKINFHFLWHDVQHGLFHFDKGILFTAKELFTRPGYSIKEFIEGKRVQHFRPISLVLILAGIYGFLFHYFNISMIANNISISGSGREFIEAKQRLTELNEWVIEHYEIISLLQLPVYAFGTYIAFKKSGYNFTEHLVINAFLTAQRLILHIIAFPLYYFFNNTATLKGINNGIETIGYVLMIWALMQFFSTSKKLRIFWKALLSLLIFLIISLIVLLTVLLNIIHAQ